MLAKNAMIAVVVGVRWAMMCRSEINAELTSSNGYCRRSGTEAERSGTERAELSVVRLEQPGACLCSLFVDVLL
jgi:hypothetical protein